MTKINGFRDILINLGIILIFIVLSYAYLFPLIEGKEIQMSDIEHWRAMSKEIRDFREKTGEEALWTNNMFSGMPAYMISTGYKGNIIRYIHSYINKAFHHASMIILYMIGFYILLSSMKIKRWLSVIGAIAFGLSSYFIIIIGAGHTSKAYAIGYLAPVIAGVILAFRKKPLTGVLLFTAALSLELYANHQQITYYGLLIIAIFGAVKLVYSFKENTLRSYFRSLLFLIAGAAIALGINFSNYPGSF